MPESLGDAIDLVGNPDDLPDAFFDALAGLLLAVQDGVPGDSTCESPLPKEVPAGNGHMLLSLDHLMEKVS